MVGGVLLLLIRGDRGGGYQALQVLLTVHKKIKIFYSVVDPDPKWIPYSATLWIRVRNTDAGDTQLKIA